MTTTNPESPATQPENFKAAHAQKQARALHLRRTFALADRVRLMADGSRRFVRFKSVEIVEHWFLLIAFAILGFTGLLQLFARAEKYALSTANAFSPITEFLMKIAISERPMTGWSLVGGSTVSV